MGLSTTVADARFAKPIDEALIAQLVKDHQALITVEEGAVGGFGAQVSQFLANNGFLDHGMKFRMMTMPDEFIEQDKPVVQLTKAGLTADNVVATALDALDYSTEALRTQPIGIG